MNICGTKKEKESNEKANFLVRRGQTWLAYSDQIRPGIDDKEAQLNAWVPLREKNSKETVEESLHESNVDVKVQNEDESRPRFLIKKHKVHTSKEKDKSTYYS